MCLAGVGRQFLLENPSDVAGAHERLAHGRGVDVELQRRFASCEQVGLEVGGHVNDKGVAATVHDLVQFGIGQGHRVLELRRLQDLGQLAREMALVFVHHCDAGVVDADHRAGGRHVDRHREGVAQKQQQDGVVAQAGQFLEPQTPDM
ncbi:hypothetical protein D3C78_1535020 [compost metagenome]